MSIQHIALAGATGNLGLPILSALLSEGYHVTVLTRPSGNSSKINPHSNLTIKTVDFASVSSLTPALQGTEVVICCVATIALGSQNPLIDASVAAGVRRFIPADFGMDTQNRLATQLPVGKTKGETQKYLRQQSVAHPDFSWTAIANGWFFDWSLRMGITIDPAKHTATLYNGGDVRCSMTNLADIGKAVVGVIKNQRDTANRVIYVHSAAVTQNELIRYAKDKDGKEWKTVVKDTESVRLESFRELDKGDAADVDAATLGFCLTAMYDPGYGCDFTGRLSNDIVGVKEMSEEEVRKVVEGCLG